MTSRHHPPGWATWILDKLLPDQDAHTPLGDFEELFHHIRDERGLLRARAWYIRSVLGMIPRRLANSAYWAVIMFQNYLKTSWRNLLRFKTYAGINLLGLTLGTTCFLLIYLFVSQERSFDRFHPGAEQVYRLNMHYIGSDYEFVNALTSAPMGPAISAAAPGIEYQTRISKVRPDPLIQVEERRFFERGGYFADSTFFRVFDGFRFMQGDPDRALTDPGSVVITRSMARRYFGLEDPIGQTVRVNNEWDATVTGVIQDVPVTSHFQFDYLVAFSTLGSGSTSWWSNPYHTYFRLAPGAEPDAVVDVTEAIVETNMGEAARRGQISVALSLQPLLDIRMNPQNNDVSEGRGSRHLATLSGIGILILLLACVNFVNLATARSDTRAREVGMRKVIGAHRGHVLAQFLGDSALLVVMAGILGLLLARLVLPAYESLLGTQLEFGIGLSEAAVLAGVGMVIILLSGGYPAWIMARVQPALMLKASSTAGSGSGTPLFRRMLVVMQFSVSVALIVITGTVYRQVDFMKTTDLGLSTDQVVVMPINQALAAKVPQLKSALTSLAEVDQVSWTNRAPGSGAYGQIGRRSDAEDESVLELKYLYSDGGYADLLDIPMVAGRFFEPTVEGATADEAAQEARPQFVLNEEATRDLGWNSPEEAVGSLMEWSNQTGEVIGVIADFHFQPMSVEMQPVMMGLRPSGEGVLMARVRSDDMASAMETLRTTWNEVVPEWPFAGSFLDEDYQALYETEERFGTTFTTFSLLAVLIACLGLFGLATFSVQRRKREMGIRKALGASGSSLVILLSREFAILVLLANLLAWPAAWWFLNGWLDNFAFRVDLGADLFLFSAFLALAIALLTISSQAIRASRVNPVDTLRFE